MKYIDWNWFLVLSPTILFCVLWVWATIYQATRTPAQRAEQMLERIRKSRGL